MADTGFAERFINAYSGGEQQARADTVRSNAYGASQGDPTAAAAVYSADPEQGAKLSALYQNKQRHDMEMHDRVLQHVVWVAQQTLDAPDAAQNGPQFQAQLTQAKQYLANIPGIDPKVIASVNTADDVRRAIAMFTPHSEYIGQQLKAQMAPLEMEKTRAEIAHLQGQTGLAEAQGDAYRQLGVGAYGQPGGTAPPPTPAQPGAPSRPGQPAQPTAAAPGLPTAPAVNPAQAPIEQRYPSDILYAARRYRQTGEMPSLGMGVMGTLAKRQMLRAAEEMSRAEGGADADVLKAASYKADKASLQQLQRYADNVNTFENTARRAWGTVETLMQQHPNALQNYGPWINQWIQTGRIAVGDGDEDVAPLAAAIMTALNETAKVTSGSLTGPLTDSARQEVGGKATINMDPKAILAVIHSAFIPDMENRRRGFIDQLGEIKGRIGGTGTPEPAPPSPVPDRPGAVQPKGGAPKPPPGAIPLNF